MNTIREKIESEEIPDRTSKFEKLTEGKPRSGGRVLRNRRYKRPFEDRKSVKRLFTPEIKRYLKGWLIRRRENPYPSRDEKKQLAVETGLTYIQICNWFANWRRKLKNTGKEADSFSWSTLIKSYNNQALGNVEQFSISSNDSIWEEPEEEVSREVPPPPSYPQDHSYTTLKLDKAPDIQLLATKEVQQQPQCFQISSTSDFLQELPQKPKKQVRLPPNSFKSSRIVNRYLGNIRKKTSRDRNGNYRRRLLEELRSHQTGVQVARKCSSLLLSKWRRSAECFQPSKQTYLTADTAQLIRGKIQRVGESEERPHGREEIDAAEALTFLARASANKAAC